MYMCKRMREKEIDKIYVDDLCCVLLYLYLFVVMASIANTCDNCNDMYEKIANAIKREKQLNTTTENIISQLKAIGEKFISYMSKKGYTLLRKGQLEGYLCITLGFNTYLKMRE